MVEKAGIRNEVAILDSSKRARGGGLRDSCDIGFRVQFNAEFLLQVMNFSIKCATS